MVVTWTALLNFTQPVIPANAGIHVWGQGSWIPGHGRHCRSPESIPVTFVPGDPNGIICVWSFLTAPGGVVKREDLSLPGKLPGKFNDFWLCVKGNKQE